MANYSSNTLWESLLGPYGFCGRGGIDIAYSVLLGFKWSQRVISQNKLQAGFKWVKLYYHDEDGGQSSLRRRLLFKSLKRGDSVCYIPWSGSRPNREFLRPNRMLKVLPAEVMLLG